MGDVFSGIGDIFGGSSEQSSEPFFAKSQKKNLNRAFEDLILPALFSGAPSFSAERARADGEQAILRSTADSGLAAEDGVTQARLAMNDANAAQIDEQETMQLLQLLLTPLGNQSSSAGHAGLNSAIQGVGGIMGLLSDRRLKENIEEVGEKEGLTIYEFSYIGVPGVRYRGVMADEVERHPRYQDAVFYNEEGFAAVDYSRIPVDMEIV